MAVVVSKPALSPGLVRLGISLGGAVLLAVAAVIQSYQFDTFDLKKFATMVVAAAGAGAIGWAKRYFADIPIDQLPLEWRESVAPSAPKEPTAAANDQS